MPGERFYDENEAEEILRVAVHDSHATGAMTRDRLVATAAELGIPEDAIVRAEQQIASEREEKERQKADAAELAEFKAYNRRRTWSSLGNWLGTSVILVGIDLITSHRITWSIWPVGIWGLVEIGHVIENLMSPATRGERFERWKRKRARRAERDAT
ncbi:MAG: 2TM domain-containing protein [Fimbriimonadales bacterium]